MPTTKSNNIELELEDKEEIETLRIEINKMFDGKSDNENRYEHIQTTKPISPDKTSTLIDSTTNNNTEQEKE